MNERICFIGIRSYGYFVNDGDIAGSGASRQVYLLSKEFGRWSDVQVVVGDYGQNSIEVHDGVELHKSYSPERDASVFGQIKKFSKLLKAMKAADADWYIQRGLVRNAFISFFISKQLGAEWVYHFAHDADVDIDQKLKESPVRKFLFKYCLNRAELIVCQNKYQKNILEQKYGIESIIIPNGYPSEEANIGFEERNYFLWIGRLTKGKNPMAFLRIAEANPDRDFVLIGSGRKNKEYAESVVSRAEGIDNVNYISGVPPQNIHQYYQHAIALVSTSKKEGFPNVFLEAWRFGTPTLSLYVDPHRFLDIDQELFANGDIQKLNGMCDLCLTKNHWESVSSNIKKEFEYRYQADDIASRYLDLMGD